MRGLELSAEAGFTDAKYTELPTDAQFLASQLIDKDSEFVYTPKTSVTLAAQYSTPLSDRFELSARIDYAHKSTIDYDVANSPLLRQKPYGLLNARITFLHVSKAVARSVRRQSNRRALLRRRLRRCGYAQSRTGIRFPATWRRRASTA